jgi:outer membrane protein TolC
MRHGEPPILLRARIVPLAILLALVASSASVRGQQQPQASSSPAETLSLEQAITLALGENRLVRSSRLEVEKYEEKLAAARTHRLPELKVSALMAQPLTGFSFSFEPGLFGTYPGVGPIPAKETEIKSPMKPTALLIGQVNQPLSQLYRVNLNIKQLETAREAAQEELRTQQQATVNDVKHAYYAILQTRSAFESAEQSIKLYREINRITEAYVVERVALKPDLLDVQTKLAKAEYDLLVLNNLLSSQKEQLNHLLGRDVRTDFNPTPVLETAQFLMRETDLLAARERALEQRPEIREARVKVKQADYDRRIKKSEFIPDISLSFNYLSPINYSDFLPKKVMSVGIYVEWEVFDWGRRKHELSEKKLASDQAAIQLREAESQVLIDVNNRFRKLQESCEMLRVAQMSQKASRAKLQVVTFKYRFESALLKDVLQAQTTLADSDYQYQQALLSFWTAKADFEKAIGEEK